MLSDIQAQMRAMKEGLDLPAAEIDLSQVAPLFVPAEFFALGNWPGPYTRLRAREIGLTWSVLMQNQTMRYVNFEMQQLWEAQGLDWRELAKRNLAARSQNRPGTFEMRRENGELFAVSFMFEDGLGPSRLLFRGTLGQMFPSGYRVAMPERSCGFAFSVTLDKAEKAKLDEIIANCYRKGTRPFVPGIFEADDLLPEEALP